MDFDVETAIKVCRSAGYYNHALSLAQKHEQHTWYLKVQLEDIKDYQTALEYMGKLSFEQVNTSFELEKSRCEQVKISVKKWQLYYICKLNLCAYPKNLQNKK